MLYIQLPIIPEWQSRVINKTATCNLVFMQGGCKMGGMLFGAATALFVLFYRRNPVQSF